MKRMLIVSLIALLVLAPAAAAKGPQASHGSSQSS
jgi:hypothetical protein